MDCESLMDFCPVCVNDIEKVDKSRLKNNIGHIFLHSGAETFKHHARTNSLIYHFNCTTLYNTALCLQVPATDTEGEAETSSASRGEFLYDIFFS